MRTPVKIAAAATATLAVAVVASWAYSHARPTVIETTVDIDANPARVWEVLTDFDAYEQWNPFITRSTGEAAVGATLTNTLDNKGSVMTFSPTVLVAEPGRELRWLGRLFLPGVADGEHAFVLEQLGPEQVRLHHSERLTGFLVPFAGSVLDVHDGFTAMNEALKARAEAPGGAH